MQYIHMSYMMIPPAKGEKQKPIRKQTSKMKLSWHRHIGRGIAPHGTDIGICTKQYHHGRFR